MSLKLINRAIEKKAPFTSLQRGEGYCYYVFSDEARNVFETRSVNVPFLNHRSDRDWIDEGIAFSQATEEKLAERGQFGERYRCASPFAPMTGARVLHL